MTGARVNLGVAIAVAGLSIVLSCWSLLLFPSAKWSLAQWMPNFPFGSIASQWQSEAWDYWKETYQPSLIGSENVLEIQRVQVQDFSDPADLLVHLEKKYGADWRKRPLLLQNLWDANQLTQPFNSTTTSRRISKAGLLQENLTIPYFRDARVQGALAPDDKAPIRDVVANITRGAPHKIGTQLLVQTYPVLIHEVAPVPIVTALFGDHFRPEHVMPLGAFGIPLLPALTTVPLFVAGTTASSKQPSSNSKDSNHPFTALHCEPIGNIAVQLEFEKHWTLVSPEHSFLLKPSSSPDGRAYFVSGHSSDAELVDIPRYYVSTRAGDALWIPTWTWHRVDYGSKRDTHSAANPEDQIAIGASLFHLRPQELVLNNPLFFFLVIPNLVKEVLQFNTQ